jgi:hypothetical protein
LQSPTELTTQLLSEEPLPSPAPVRQGEDISSIDPTLLEISLPLDSQPAINMNYEENGQQVGIRGLR